MRFAGVGHDRCAVHNAPTVPVLLKARVLHRICAGLAGNHGARGFVLPFLRGLRQAKAGVVHQQRALHRLDVQQRFAHALRLGHRQGVLPPNVPLRQVKFLAVVLFAQQFRAQLQPARPALALCPDRQGHGLLARIGGPPRAPPAAGLKGLAAHLAARFEPDGPAAAAAVHCGIIAPRIVPIFKGGVAQPVDAFGRFGIHKGVVETNGPRIARRHLELDHLLGARLVHGLARKLHPLPAGLRLGPGGAVVGARIVRADLPLQHNEHLVCVGGVLQVHPHARFYRRSAVKHGVEPAERVGRSGLPCSHPYGFCAAVGKGRIGDLLYQIGPPRLERIFRKFKPGVVDQVHARKARARGVVQPGARRAERPRPAFRRLLHAGLRGRGRVCLQLSGGCCFGRRRGRSLGFLRRTHLQLGLLFRRRCGGRFRRFRRGVFRQRGFGRLLLLCGGPILRPYRSAERRGGRTAKHCQGERHTQRVFEPAVLFHNVLHATRITNFVPVCLIQL